MKRMCVLAGVSRAGFYRFPPCSPAPHADPELRMTRRQRVFVLEKLVGLNDKDAALAAGYSLSVAENTKQRIWKPRVRAEYERVRRPPRVVKLVLAYFRSLRSKQSANRRGQIMPRGRLARATPWDFLFKFAAT